MLLLLLLLLSLLSFIILLYLFYLNVDSLAFHRLVRLRLALLEDEKLTCQDRFLVRRAPRLM